MRLTKVYVYANTRKLLEQNKKFCTLCRGTAMEHDLEKLAVTALPISASPIMRHDSCMES